MALRTVFIGIDKHQDPSIRELAAARRDATALWALFGDTVDTSGGLFLVDQAATHATVLKALEDALLGASPEDTVVISFAGHGTRDHRLVLYDTSLQDLPATTIPMETLGDFFRRSPARAVLCILDCCFSGKAPARVLEEGPVPRDPGDPLEGLAGVGRLLLTASGPLEPALELSGHGLLTEAVMHTLQAGDGSVDLVRAMADILERVRGAAARLGYVQTPTLYGHVEGGLALPRLVAGDRFSKAFPELTGKTVTSAIQDLDAFGIPQPVLTEWSSRFSGGLNALQQKAVNEHRILDGRSVVVVAPTSSGKTFIGEMAAIRAHMDGRKSVFLLPYRALVAEKYDQFALLYGQALGLRVIRSTGDYLDDNGRFLAGQYDLALLTYEMFLRLAISSPHVLGQLGLVVLDEAQFITDPKRGIVVELLLTLLLTARDRGVSPQLVALSAVIGDANGFHDWLGCDLLLTTERPVPLREGVLDRSGVFEVLDENGVRQTEQLIPSGGVVQRRNEPSAQDVIVPLVRRLVSEEQKVIVFRNAKGPAEGCAQYLARDLGLPPANEALAQLPTHDLSGASERLRACLNGGTAFHDTNLGREERQVVERAFRDPASPVRVLAATTTVAAGVNTPASTVILAEQEFLGEDGRKFTVAEYKNMAGRAGRLGFNEKGTSIILAGGSYARGVLFDRYVTARPESLRSSFTDGEVSTWLLRLLTQVEKLARDEVPGMLLRTYAGFCMAKEDPGWAIRTRARVEDLLRQMTSLGLLEEEVGTIRLSLLGQACGRSALSFESAMRLVALLRRAGARMTAEGLVAILQGLPEADALGAPMGGGKRGEPTWIGEAASRFGEHLIRELQSQAEDLRTYHKRCKRACILHEWIMGTPLRTIEDTFTRNARYGAVTAGNVHSYADATRFWLGSAMEILQIVFVGMGPDTVAVDALLQRLELGLPAEALPLMGLPLQLSRGECLALHGAQLLTPAQVWAASKEVLESLIAPPRVAELLALKPV